MVTNTFVLLTQFNLLVGINKWSDWFKASDIEEKVLLYRKIMYDTLIFNIYIFYIKDKSIPFYQWDHLLWAANKKQTIVHFYNFLVALQELNRA